MIKRKAQFSDLRIRDIELLQSACFAKDEYFVCLGKSYYKLKSLNLVTDEYKVTHDGIQFLRELYDKAKEKKNAVHSK